MSPKYLGLIIEVKVMNFVDHIKKYSDKKLVKLWAYCLGFNQSCQDHLYWLNIKHQESDADVICDQAYNSSSHEKLESLQHSACLPITGAERRISSEKIYQELGLESLKLRRWFRKICHFYKISKEKSRSYLLDLNPNLNKVHETRQQ